MKSFEIGKSYTHGWIGDSNLKTTWTVTKRTNQTITITDGRETKTCRIIKVLTGIYGAEAVMPFGNYSTAPTLTAN